MKYLITILQAILIMACSLLAPAAEKAVLVHNTLEEINACKGKLKLKPVRVWGGDEEEDEQKLFRTPAYVAVDKKGDFYISDSYSHHIKVFDRDGNYLRTIGGKGQGPGDTYTPHQIVFTPDGDLVVYESGARRLQYFSPTGKSKEIRKLKGCVLWFGITSKNQLVLYDHKRTFNSRILVSLVNEKLKPVKDIGVYHDSARIYTKAKTFHVAMDGNDNIIVANSYTPVIRKYNLDGEMTLVITYDPPVKLPVEVTLNQEGDEIEIKRPENWGETKFKKYGSKHGVSVQRIQTGGIIESICRDIGTDTKDRIYLLSLRRVRTLEEFQRIPGVIVTDATFEVVKRELPLDREMDHLRILVFSPQGKVIAEAPVTKECDEIVVSGNRLFMMDPFLNKRILEYEIQIE